MNPRSAVDLHTHSSASDGVLDPAALVTTAADRGVKLFALTDHDTIAGLEEARATACRLGIVLVSGVELSADWRGRVLHVIGLAFDPCASALNDGLRRLESLRASRAERIAARLADTGAAVREALAAMLASIRLPTRTHFARVLVATGAAPDLDSAFDRWLRHGRSADVATEWPSLAEAVGWVVAAGGCAVLAHPMRYPLSPAERRELCREFASAGGRGIEVVTGGGTAADRNLATSLAVRTGLAGSVGSDFHDPANPWNPPGRLAKLPRSVRPVWSDPPFPVLETDAGPA